MAVLLRPELIPPRLRRGCIAIDLHHLADAVKGAKLRYMTLAMESRERDGAQIGTAADWGGAGPP